MMPAEGSVWRKDVEWRRVVLVDNGFVTFQWFGSSTRSEVSDETWHAWSADAVQVPTETQQPVGLSDADIDRIAERMHRKMRDMTVVKPLPVMKYERPELDEDCVP